MKTAYRFYTAIAATLTTLATAPHAFAHQGEHHQTLSAGFLHVVTQPDHLIAVATLALAATAFVQRRAIVRLGRKVIRKVNVKR